jgi:hypothetical protein
VNKVAKRFKYDIEVDEGFIKKRRSKIEYDLPEDADCLHDACPECQGTGRKRDGQLCIHSISCYCSKCLPVRY